MPTKTLPDNWPAPAKINLFLHVTGRRADGYHTLQTLFQFLDYGDSLSFEISADGAITRSAPLAGVPEDADLTLCAARALKAASGTEQGVRITLTKRLPVGGGLGGGSSDAATTLLALNRLWGLHRPLAELAQLGLGLGADVPVFIHGRAAWAEGVGEILTAAEPEERWTVVLIPPVSVSTARVFEAFQLTVFTPAITIRAFLAGQTGNDLEPAVCRLYPEVGKTLDWLRRFGDARMSGSGGCVFLPVANADAGHALLAQCPASLASGFIARAVNRHPLHTMIGLK
jgi:4-diphosphocytidyl-2-C-methyl-D-erythritol kinase